MTLAASRSPADAAAHAPALTVSIEKLHCALLWLLGFCGVFVFVEPSPYEVSALLTMFFFAVTGLTLRASLAPLMLALILYNVGFSIAVVPVLHRETAIWVAVSWFLSATALFYAAMLGTDTHARLDWLLRGTLAAAVAASLAAIVGYFHLVPRLTELFLRYERARGTFNDPNVLGAFLVLPAVLALQRVLAGTPRDMLRGAIMLGLFATAILLSFSRAAWGQVLFSCLLTMVLTFLTSRSSSERARIVLLGVAGALSLAVLVAALLSIGSVASLFDVRANLEQSYDVGYLGRFGRYTLGFDMALDHPLGIGPSQFKNFFLEDPHNAYLNSFLSGGWLTGFCYLAITLVTLVTGLRFVFVATPWRAAMIAVFASYAGAAGESAVIDSDHWRHYFLLLGVMWGLITAARPYVRAPARVARPTARPA